MLQNLSSVAVVIGALRVNPITKQIALTPDCLEDSTKLAETDWVISVSGDNGLVGLRGRSLSSTGGISE